MIAIDAPEPDDGMPKREHPKPKRPDSKPTFEELIQQLEPQLDKVPEEMRIPPIPPNEDAAEEVQKYVRETMGLPVAADVPNWILIGNESVERSKMREGRIGDSKGSYVFAFLYPYEPKKFHTVIVHPKDGIDPRMIAKAVLWGLVGEIPATLAQSEIRNVEAFFLLRCLNTSQLLDAPALEMAKAEYRKEIDEEIALIRNRLAQSESQILVGNKSLAAATEREATAKADADWQHNRAENWRMATFAAIALIPTAILVARWLGG